jgi:Lrp/AsnC family transcriptional regulator, leucine-responsive regulatory protein
MKDITRKLIEYFKKGYCTPQIARLARELKEPSTTLQYNIKKLEKEKSIRAYKAVFDYKKINQGFCSFILINLDPNEYGNPERIAKEFLKYDEIESIDIITGDWEIMIKIRAADQDNYFEFVKRVLSRKGITKIKTLTSLKQLKTEFIAL